MARKTKTAEARTLEESGIELVSPKLKSSIEEIAKKAEVEHQEELMQDGIEITKPVLDVKPPKTVRVMLKNNHRCCIGGEWYSFNAKKQYNVPEQVKDILRNSDLLLPL